MDCCTAKMNFRVKRVLGLGWLVTQETPSSRESQKQGPGESEAGTFLVGRKGLSQALWSPPESESLDICTFFLSLKSGLTTQTSR